MMDVPPDAHGQTEAPGDALSMLKPPAISASWWKKHRDSGKKHGKYIGNILGFHGSNHPIYIYIYRISWAFHGDFMTSESVAYFTPVSVRNWDDPPYVTCQLHG